MNENDMKTEQSKVRLPAEGSLILSSSPHLRTGDSTHKVMLLVILALIPAVLASVWFFGWNALRVVVYCMAFCALFEYIWCVLAKTGSTLSNLSALVTGLILALNVSPLTPWWLCLAGAFIAIIVAKQVFGGLGQNPFNPAAVARVAMLVGATGPMTMWMNPAPGAILGLADKVDAVASATPLAAAKAVAGNAAEIARYNSWDFLWNAFLGNVGGSLGETSALAILIGGIALIALRVIHCHIPLAIFVTITVFVWIVNLASPGLTPGPMFHLLTGGVMIGAFFMATDMVTSPVTHLGGVVFGVGIGVIVCVIRIWGSFPEGMSFAIVIMNALVPLIDKMCYKRPFGWHPSSVNILQPRRGEIK